MATYQTRSDVESDVLAHTQWDQEENAYRVTGPTEWTEDMDGVRIVNGTMFIDGDAAAEAVRSACIDAGVAI